MDEVKYREALMAVIRCWLDGGPLASKRAAEVAIAALGLEKLSTKE